MSNTNRFFSRWTAVFLAMAVVAGCGSYTPPNASVVDRPRTAAEIQDRQKVAQAMFAELCKKAGFRIYRTAEDVEGIFLMKIRPEEWNEKDQFLLSDPYGRDSSGDRYIMNFLRGFYHQDPFEKPVLGDPPMLGFLFVEAISPVDGRRYRYTGGMKEGVETISGLIGGEAGKKFVTTRFRLEEVPATGKSPRYGVTYEDISTHEQREYWIAGSSLKVIDLETNQVMAERIGYMVDWAQGSLAGGRSPWYFAADQACPGFQQNPNFPVRRGSASQVGQTLHFVEKVLKPKASKGD